jgi:hypothetical protein
MTIFRMKQVCALAELYQQFFGLADRFIRTSQGVNTFIWRRNRSFMLFHSAHPGINRRHLVCPAGKLLFFSRSPQFWCNSRLA